MEAFYPLVLADHTDWHSEREYSPQARDVLLRVLRLLDRSRHREPAFARAYPVISPLLDAPMALHQRLRLWYFAARARAARSEGRAALHWLDKTLELERQRDDTADLAYLHYLRGGIYRRMLRFSRASGDHRQALAIQADDMPRSRFHDSAFRLRTLAQLASFEFYLGHYWAAQQYVEQAQHLTAYVPANSIPAGTLKWIYALLNRWSGDPRRAFKVARSAAKIFVDSGAASSAVSISNLAAECALDVAERLDVQSSECHRFLALAREDLAAARKLAKSDKNQSGLVLGRLGEVRWSRIARRDEDRLTILEDILARARELDNVILIAQTLTTFGDEFALAEEWESANTRYRAALDALDGSDCPAAGVWAWRALHIPREWNA